MSLEYASASEKPQESWTFDDRFTGDTYIDDVRQVALRKQIKSAKKDSINVALPVRLTFRDTLPDPDNPKALKVGALMIQRDWLVNIPKLDPSPATPFAFYIWNKGISKFIEVRLPENVAADGGRKVALTQAKGNLAQAIGLISSSSGFLGGLPRRPS